MALQDRYEHFEFRAKAALGKARRNGKFWHFEDGVTRNFETEDRSTEAPGLPLSAHREPKLGRGAADPEGQGSGDRRLGSLRDFGLCWWYLECARTFICAVTVLFSFLDFFCVEVEFQLRASFRHDYSTKPLDF